MLPAAPVLMPELATPVVPTVIVSAHRVLGPPLVVTPVTVMSKQPDAVTCPVAKPLPLWNDTEPPARAARIPPLVSWLLVVSRTMLPPARTPSVPLLMTPVDVCET